MELYSTSYILECLETVHILNKKIFTKILFSSLEVTDYRFNLKAVI